MIFIFKMLLILYSYVMDLIKIFILWFENFLNAVEQKFMSIPFIGTCQLFLLAVVYLYVY